MTDDELISELKRIRQGLSRIADRMSDIVDRDDKHLRQVRIIDREIRRTLTTIDNQVYYIKNGYHSHNGKP